MDEIKKYEPFFGHWYIDKFIGQGQYGKVYRIKRQNLDKIEHSAIKWLPLPTNEDELAWMQRDQDTNGDGVSTRLANCRNEMESEIEILKELRHNRHIVGYEDHFIYKRTDRIGYDIVIKMELLTPLKERLQQPFTVDDVIRLGVDISDGLVACSERKIIHRDIKPENIFVDSDDRFRLGDFGIARQLDESMCSSMRGTPLYMAPEVFRSERYDYTVDTYSLAMVLYCLLNCLRVPFAPLEPKVLSKQQKDMAFSKRLEPVRAKREKIPPPANGFRQLNRILEKALNYEPSRRYQSAGELKKDLQLLLKTAHPQTLSFAVGNIPVSTPKSTPKPTPKPTPKSTPKPTPKSTPKPTPKSTPKPIPNSIRTPLLLLLLLLLLLFIIVIIVFFSL